MSHSKSVNQYKISVVIEEREDKRVHWEVFPDPKLKDVGEISYQQLAASGIPLSGMGALALEQLLLEQFIELALNRAHVYWLHNLMRQQRSAGEDQVKKPIEEETTVVH